MGEQLSLNKLEHFSKISWLLKIRDGGGGGGGGQEVKVDQTETS